MFIGSLAGLIACVFVSAYTSSIAPIIVVGIFGICALLYNERLRESSTRFVVDSDRLVAVTPKLLFRNRRPPKLDVFPFADSALVSPFKGRHVLQRKRPAANLRIPFQLDGYDDLIEFLSARVSEVSIETALDNTKVHRLEEGVELRYGRSGEQVQRSIGLFVIFATLVIFVARNLSVKESLFVLGVTLIGGGLLAFAAYELGPRIRVDKHGITRQFMRRRLQILYSDISKYEFARKGFFEGIAIHCRDEVYFFSSRLNEFQILPEALNRYCPEARVEPRAPCEVKTKPYYKEIAFVIFFLSSSVSILVSRGFDGQPGLSISDAVLGILLGAVPPVAYVIYGLLNGVKSIVFDVDTIEVYKGTRKHQYSVSSLETITHEYSEYEHKFVLKFKDNPTQIKIKSVKMYGSGFALDEALMSLYPDARKPILNPYELYF